MGCAHEAVRQLPILSGPKVAELVMPSYRWSADSATWLSVGVGFYTHEDCDPDLVTAIGVEGAFHPHAPRLRAGRLDSGNVWKPAVGIASDLCVIASALCVDVSRETALPHLRQSHRRRRED